MKKIILIIISLLSCIAYSEKQPDINVQDVQKKISEILKAHVNYDHIDEEIIKRALSNFIDELDPHKMYLLDTEVSQYINADKTLIAKCLEEYSQGKLDIFEEIYNLYTSAVDRRNLLEKEIQSKTISEKIDSKKFKDIKWAKTKEELATRLLEIRMLQTQGADKIDDITKEDILKHIEKRRTNREKEFLNADIKDKHICTLLLKALSSSLDTHTNYFTPNEASQFMIQVQQRLFGIGAQLRDTLNGFTILRIIDGGPAQKSGKLKINDRIIAVNHEPIIGMDITEGVEKIRGEIGTEVLLTVLREHADEKTDKFDITLTRGEIVIEETRLKSSFIPYADGVIAYLKLYSFYQDQNTSSSNDLKKALNEIADKHTIKGVLLDLRGNTGGLLSEAVGVAGLFIHQGIIASVKDCEGKVQHLREVNGNCQFEGPLVILTDKASASASEIVAQSLQDYKRAIVVGDAHSFGKGSFQTLTLDAKGPGKINPKGEYKVTRGRYYTVSGRSPQLVGVQADITVPGLFSNADIGEEFAKYPLENDQIEANFDDKLEDIPFIHRYQAAKMYKHDTQKVSKVFTSHLENLRKNSEIRISQNTDYQTFLEQIALENYDDDSIDFFRKSDFQKIEAENILKDLIFYHEKKAAS